MGEFGDKFRKAREKKEISLDDVSNVTKIGARMLRAIEEEDFDQLPGGVFNKGFIRAYAKHLGLNDEEAVSDYLACLRQAQIDAHEVWEPEASAKPSTAQRLAAPQKRRSTDSSRSAAKGQAPVQVEELPDLQLPRAEHVRPPRNDFARNSNGDFPWRILAVAAIVAVLATILWMRHSHSAHSAAGGPLAGPQPATTVSVPASDPASTAESHNQPSNPAPANSTTATSSQPSSPSNHPREGAQSSATSPNPLAATPATPSASNSANNAEEDDVSISAFKPTVPRSSANSTALLKLVIRAQETSWISVQADGQTVSQETLIAPAHASIRATREIVARIGNAAGVTFLWNGQEIPADGAEAEVKTFVFDANGMRVVPSTPSPVQSR